MNCHWPDKAGIQVEFQAGFKAGRVNRQDVAALAASGTCTGLRG